MTRDPLGYGGGVNLYAYTGNNPVNESDSSGLYEDDSNHGPYHPGPRPIGMPNHWPMPPPHVPGGPWRWAPNPTNERGGELRGPPNRGLRGKIHKLTFNDAKGRKTGYWK